MEIEIMVFKATGKYYDDCIVRNEIDLPLWSDEFKRFVANNLPAKCLDGYAVVRDTKEDLQQSFHFVLYKLNELLQYRSEE